jgi:Uma2 family endonuclease
MELVKKRFNLEDYYLMHESGIFTKDERVELIDGEIIKMSPIGRYHVAYVNRLNSLFTELLGRLVIVSVQNPVILSNLSQPQPDIALLKPRRDFYISGIAQVSDVFLLVEVADTTLVYDRDVKIPLYATNGISAVWLVNIVDRVIVVYSQPSTDGYKKVETCLSGDCLCLTAFPTINIAVNQILGIFE